MDTRPYSRRLVAAIAVLAVAAAVYWTFAYPARCRPRLAPAVIQGSSLHGILEGGEVVSINRAAYVCAPVMRGDIIEYRYASSRTPIVKIVKAVPGDAWGLEKTEDGVFEIIVNGTALRNSFGSLYKITAKQAALLQLYIRDYKGVIPDGAYLILGNMSNGSFDSTQLGLISGRGILGKVETSP
jgi:signal peptidase I